MRRIVLLLIALGSISVLQACAAEVSTEDAEQAAAPLEIRVTEQTDMDLRVEASRGDAFTSFVVHRNGVRDSDFVRDPDIDSPYDSDLIVRNRHDFPFITSGNHGVPTDPETGVPDMEPRMSFDQDAQIADLELTVEAAVELCEHDGVGDEFRWELRSLYYLAVASLEGARTALVTEHSDLPQTEDGIGVTRQALSGNYIHRVQIRWVDCCWVWGHHSAVFLEILDSNYGWVAGISTRNHGREATDGSMSTVNGCPKTFTGRSAASPNFQPFAYTDTFLTGDAGGCWTSYGTGSGQHVCNDDSYAQYLNIKYDTAAYWSTCNDSTLRQWAPSCD